MCWYGSDSSNGLAMVASREFWARDVRRKHGRVEIALELMLWLHLVHEGLLERHSKRTDDQFSDRLRSRRWVVIEVGPLTDETAEGV